MVQRVTYRRRKSFHTKSNIVRKVRTPGGKLVVQYVGKRGKRPTCGEYGCDRPLSGVRLLACSTRSVLVPLLASPGAGMASFTYLSHYTSELVIKAVRPKELSRLSKRQKTVTRPYGGAKCGKCVRTRIVRAFLIEEQKIVKKVLKAQANAKPEK
eukprot:scaffold135409_cov33-Tisochrysis_lutea.AAC.2